MDSPKFEKKYREKGGINKLTELRSLLFSHDYIANHFGVSRARVSDWMKLFFGKDYDPREDRKEAIISSMIEFAKNNSFPLFRYSYRGTPYYKEVLEKCYELKIYERRK
jgi:hypothetical protein